jgi:lipopolysaccharide export system protein LptA
MKRHLACLALANLLFATAGNAQLISSSDEPVDITSDAAEFQEDYALWTGNVRVVQGEAILTADRLEATIDEAGEFQTITAYGAVRYTNGKEAIAGRRAVFEQATRTITVTEKVILTQGKQVMSAGAVIYWIDSGKVKFTPAPGDRIRGIFYPSSDFSI